MPGRQLADESHQPAHVFLVGRRAGEVLADEVLVALDGHRVDVGGVFRRLGGQLLEAGVGHLAVGAAVHHEHGAVAYAAEGVERAGCRCVDAEFVADYGGRDAFELVGGNHRQQGLAAGVQEVFEAREGRERYERVDVLVLAHGAYGHGAAHRHAHHYHGHVAVSGAAFDVVGHGLHVAGLLVGKADAAAGAPAVAAQVGHDGGHAGFVEFGRVAVERSHRGVLDARQADDHGLGALGAHLVGKDVVAVGGGEPQRVGRRQTEVARVVNHVVADVIFGQVVNHLPHYCRAAFRPVGFLRLCVRCQQSACGH